MPSNHLVLCCPLLLLPSIFPSIRVFSKESTLPIRQPKCWSFSFGISPSNESSGLSSFRMDWFVLLLKCELGYPDVLTKSDCGRSIDEGLGADERTHMLGARWLVANVR